LTEYPPKSIAALSGRRIDATGAKRSYFPLEMADVVSTRLADLLLASNVGCLVCSAACGADLLALKAAESLGIRRRIILPFEKHRFKMASVVDRPGAWGEIFERVVAHAESTGDLIILEGTKEERAFSLATKRIITEATSMLASEHLAIVVWEGAPHEGLDYTDEFLTHALAARMTVHRVSTVQP